MQEMHYIQLGRTNKESIELMSELEKICCYLRYEGEPGSEEWIDTLAENEEKGLIGMIKKKLDTIRQDDRAYYDAISREKFLFDQYERERTIAEQDQVITEQRKALEEKERENEELRRRIRELERK